MQDDQFEVSFSCIVSSRPACALRSSVSSNSNYHHHHQKAKRDAEGTNQDDRGGSEKTQAELERSYKPGVFCRLP